MVFGVGAEEAERLAARLEQDERADPRFSQGLLWGRSQAVSRAMGWTVRRPLLGHSLRLLITPGRTGSRRRAVRRAAG